MKEMMTYFKQISI